MTTSDKNLRIVKNAVESVTGEDCFDYDSFHSHIEIVVSTSINLSKLKEIERIIDNELTSQNVPVGITVSTVEGRIMLMFF
jgi:hypothetical protein